MIPPLPWKFDFADKQVPVTWIGARYRHEARDVDGEPMIVKISTIPKGTRSQSWFGPTDLHDYTVTADVRAGEGEGGKLPDMGVIAQRYTLDLMGQSQQLQVRTWAAQLRMAKSTKLSWQAGVWYTLKLKVSNQDDGTALVQGKAWPRDETEPNEWTVTATDASPNRLGSPGLFGNATNARNLHRQRFGGGSMSERFTTVKWIVCGIAALGFAFDIYELLMLPLIVRPCCQELIGAAPGTPDFEFWVGMLFFVPAMAGGVFGLLGGYLTDLWGRRRVLVLSILLYAVSALASGFVDVG